MSTVSPSTSVAVTAPAPATTCAAVTMSPLGMTDPVPKPTCGPHPCVRTSMAAATADVRSIAGVSIATSVAGRTTSTPSEAHAPNAAASRTVSAGTATPGLMRVT